MGIKITELIIEDFKKIQAVRITPAENGLTIIGGKNAQGKTSVLDAIAWSLGGDKLRPSKPQRDGSETASNLKVVIDNGLIVERSGRNGNLKVTDPTGLKGNQKLLNSLVEYLALDLPKFMESNSKDKANTLLQIIGVKDQLSELEAKEKEFYDERTFVRRNADQKKKFAEEQQFFEGIPTELVSTGQLIQQQQVILERNAENKKKRDNLALGESKLAFADENVKGLSNLVEDLKLQLHSAEQQLVSAKKDYQDLSNKVENVRANVATLQDESTEEIENQIANIYDTNAKIKANQDKLKAENDAKVEQLKVEDLTAKIEDTRKAKYDLLKGTKLPLEGLSIEDGDLTYNNQKWDNMSGAEQLKVATAIVRKINPKCGFVLIDKLEQMDLDTLNEFGEWLESEGLQAIATRVSTGDECTIVIEDGHVKEE